MKKENLKSPDIPKSDIKEEEEEFSNLPEFIQNVIGNFYNSFSRKNSNSKEQSSKSINKINNTISNNSLNNNQISEFNLSNNRNRNIIANNEHIKIFNIKDSNLSIMKKSSRFNSIMENDRREYIDNIKECSICFRVIINYGLLSNCDDVFCYECIKQWRNQAKAKSRREMFRRCPLCNCESPLLIKSKFYLIGEEKKQKILEYRNENNNIN